MYALDDHTCLAFLKLLAMCTVSVMLHSQAGADVAHPRETARCNTSSNLVCLQLTCDVSPCRSTLRLQYASAWRRTLVKPLLDRQEEGIPDVIQVRVSPSVDFCAWVCVAPHCRSPVCPCACCPRRGLHHLGTAGTCGASPV